PLTTARLCELYASGHVVVSRRPPPPMPPTPWVGHNAAGERPFIAAELPLVSIETKRRAAQSYRGYPRSKSFIIGPTGHPYVFYGQTSTDDAVRRGLEHCGYEAREA